MRGAASCAPASIVPGFAEQTVLTALSGPTDMAFAPDGRVFVSEKSGIVKVFPSITTNTPTVVADLRTQVFNSGDRGLLSLALDPQFPTRPYLYLLYTFDAPIGGTAPTWGTAGVSGDNCPDPPGLNTDGCVVSGRLSRITLSGTNTVASTNLVTVTNLASVTNIVAVTNLASLTNTAQGSVVELVSTLVWATNVIAATNFVNITNPPVTIVVAPQTNETPKPPSVLIA